MLLWCKFRLPFFGYKLKAINKQLIGTHSHYAYVYSALTYFTVILFSSLLVWIAFTFQKKVYLFFLELLKVNLKLDLSICAY